MKEKVASLETQIALMQRDINTIKTNGPELPTWLKNSAIILLFTMFGQIMTSVWWASSIDTNLQNLQEDVGTNTEFRLSYIEMHNKVMVKLKGLEFDNDHIKSMIKEVKDKLRYVDIKAQHKQLGVE